MRVLILIGSHLSTAPRPQKEATALAEAGHDVTICGLWFDPALAQLDVELARGKPWRLQPALDLQSRSLRGRLLWARERLQFRLARERFARSRAFSPVLLGYGIRALLSRAMAVRADLTIVHTEGGLWIADQLLDAGYRVGVDFEDWFSEDLLPENRVHRPVARLRELESRVLRTCTYRTTTSHAMAEALSSAFDVSRPAVVYNTFPDEAGSDATSPRDRVDPRVPSLHWFSQTIGRGRGLEQLFAALPLVRVPVEVHLRGRCAPEDRAWIESATEAARLHRLVLHDRVPPAELASRIAEHDIGLALEQPVCPSRDLTITNKLFQSMQAGLAIVATETAGQREVVAKHPSVGRLVPPDDPAAMAAAIENLAGSSERLAAAKCAAPRVVREFFGWELQRRTIAELAECAAGTIKAGVHSL